MNWINNILRRPIPRVGRCLTETECRSLRALGYHLSRHWIVKRHADRADLGIVYHPSSTGSGYDHAGIYVTD